MMVNMTANIRQVLNCETIIADERWTGSKRQDISSL